MATTSMAFLSIPGGSHLKSRELWSSKHNLLGNTSRLTYQRKSHQQQTKKLTVRAEYNDRKGGEGDFVAGFLVGVALCGSAAYIFSPQIKKAMLRRDDHGFTRPKGPAYEAYYDEGLEKTGHILNEKIGQLNSAIDKVYSRLRGGNKVPPFPVENMEDQFTV